MTGVSIPIVTAILQSSSRQLEYVIQNASRSSGSSRVDELARSFEIDGNTYSHLRLYRPWGRVPAPTRGQVVGQFERQLLIHAPPIEI